MYFRRLSVSVSTAVAFGSSVASADWSSGRRCQMRSGQFWHGYKECRLQTRLVLQHIWNLPAATNLRTQSSPLALARRVFSFDGLVGGW
jgi:hypothetical protein